MRLVMPVSSDLASFSADNRTRTKYRGKRVPSAVFLAIPLPMGYHACIRAHPLRSPPKSQPMTPFLNTTRIYVDADACPVKDEIYRVAARHGLPLSVAAGQFIRVPQEPLIELITAVSRVTAPHS